MQSDWSPTTPQNCQRVPGPFYHGTRADLTVGSLIAPGHRSHSAGRALKHVPRFVCFSPQAAPVQLPATQSLGAVPAVPL